MYLAMMASNSPEFMILRTSSAEKSRYFAAEKSRYFATDMSASQPSAVMIELTTAGSTCCSFRNSSTRYLGTMRTPLLRRLSKCGHVRTSSFAVLLL